MGDAAASSPPGSAAGRAGDESRIQIQVNGELRLCGTGLRLDRLLETLGYRPRLVVVEFNGEILPRQCWADQPVREADVLEVVTIVGGGS